MVFSVTSPQTTDSTVTITRIAVLTLADATNFAADGDFACDGDGGNDAVGTVVSKSGNVVTLNVTSGTFVATNGIDNADPFVGDETTITSIDEEYFLIDKTKTGSQLNSIVLYVDYTKDTESGITVYYSNKDSDLIDKYFYDSFISSSSNVADKDYFTMQASDTLKFYYDISKSEESIRFKIVPADIYTSGTINLAIGENNIHT